MVLQHLYTEIVKNRPWEFISCHASFSSHSMGFAAGCTYSSPSHFPCSSSGASVVVSQSELGMGIKAEQWSISREPASIPRVFIPGSCVLVTNRSNTTACPGHGGSGSLALWKFVLWGDLRVRSCSADPNCPWGPSGSF